MYFNMENNFIYDHNIHLPCITEINLHIDIYKNNICALFYKNCKLIS